MTSSLTAPTIDAPFIESGADQNAAALRARLDKNGYLFFRNLVPAADMKTMSQQ